MHPGPMNRGVEIDATRSPTRRRRSSTRQVRAGLVVRMAVLYDLLRGDRAPRRRERTRGLRRAPDPGTGGARRRPARARRARRRPRRGLDARARRARARRRDRGARRRSRRAGGRRGDRGRRLHAAACVHRPARAPAHAGPGAQGGPRDGHGGRGRGRLLHVLAMPNTDPVVDSPQVLRFAARARRDGCPRARRIPGARSRSASTASRWRRSASSPTTAPAGSRTTAGRCSRPRSCGARLQYAATTGRVLSLHCEDTSLCARRRHARGRRVRACSGSSATRPSRESTMIARDLRIAQLREPAAAHLPPARRRSRSRRCGARAQLGRRRLRRGLAAPPAADRRGSARPRRGALQDEPAAGGRAPSAGADRGPARRHASTASRPTTRRTTRPRRRCRSRPRPTA